MAAILSKCDQALKRRAAAGEVLLAERQKTGRLYVLASGTVEVLRGDTRVALISDAGAVFGEMSILLNTPHTATVRTVTDCELFAYDDALAFMRSDPEITFEIAALLAQRLNTATTYLADIKQQYAGSGSHLAMVSDVLASLVTQPARAYDPGSDREPNAS
jgi:CRP/FNR family transcriptional regulator, cyclic AMP receptor protein